ncbi:MAG: TonB-dependent receptor [Sphingobium sp.]
MVKSSRQAGLRASLALSCVGSALLPIAAAPLHAQSSAQGESRSLGSVTVTDSAINEAEPGRQQASPKAVRPIRDTPQTITVLGKEVLQQQNLISLTEALSTVPGITFGAGEGGSGYGDSINLRGYSANNDITVDGIRDSAQYSRTDNFNIEQIEITNGANSVTSGSGSVGGTINLVSKRPLDRDQAIFQAGLGTDNYYRVTADVNKKLTDNIAVRLNGMYHHNDIPGREVEQNDRWGVAPAITLGIGGPTQMTVQYLHQEDVNIPQFGVPYFVSASYVGALPGGDRSSYYGFRNLDTQRIKVDQINLIFDHAFSDTLSLRNYTRYQDVRQFTVADGPEGTFCLPNNLTPTGAACVSGSGASAITVPAGYFLASGGSRGNTRQTRNRIAFNQTDLKAVVNTGFIEHTLDLGFAYMRENYTAATGNSQRLPNGTSTTTNYLYPTYAPNAANTYNLPVNFLVSSRPRSRVENYAFYLFDAMKLGSHIELNAGVRWERNVGRSQTDSINVSAPTAPATVNPNFGVVTPGAVLRNADNLFSYRIGLVYKPVETVSLYVAYGNSKTPSQSTVNGSCTSNLTATIPSSTCSSRPEGAKNYEIGGKAELFDGGLLLTAALFRNERDSYRVASGDPLVPDQQTDGRSRVHGLSLGASGHITPAWSITANYTYLESKLLQGVSDKCLANPGSGNCTNTVANPNPGAGYELQAVPKHSGSIYTAYTLPFGLTIGYSATYQGKFAFNAPTTQGATVYYSDDYLVHNANIIYDFSKALSAQVNVKNIGDKLYYTRIRSNGNGWATPGDARSAVVTLTYKM